MHLNYRLINNSPDTSVKRTLELVPAYLFLGSFSNDDGDGNDKSKTAIGLLSKTSLHVHHAFFFLSFSLPLLHDYDVKMPNVNKQRRNFLPLSKLECGPQEI